MGSSPSTAMIYRRSCSRSTARISGMALLSFPRDRRDVRRAIEHWLRNTWATDSIPLLDTFDFSPMRGDWGQPFLICGGDAVEDAVFVTYGLGFAQLLGLPKRPVTTIPFLQ